MKLLQKTLWAVCQIRSFNHISLQDIVPAASSSSQPRHERRKIIFADYEETTPSLRKVMSLKLVDKSKSFGGEQCVYTHFSSLLGCEMKFGVYLPPAVTELNQKCPVLYYLSGLTCTHENFIGKSGVQQHAAQHGLIIVNPDTSPRGLNIPGEDDSYDFGTGAGFYVNATEEPWSTNYKMYSYVTEELPSLVNESLPVLENKVSIFGHSMGGHGALICALKNPQLYKSVSAFAPICNPSASSWGKKALSGYLGEKTDAWAEWDATRLAEKYNGPPREIFIDQGSADKFLQNDLLPDNLLKAAVKNGNLQTIYKLREGYGHDYFYIATFISEHIAYHAKMLKA